MPLQTVSPRIKGFICLNAHPVGCAANVAAQIAAVRRGAPGRGIRDALVLGSSTGYGLSSLITAVFAYGARAAGVCLERPAQGEKTRIGPNWKADRMPTANPLLVMSSTRSVSATAVSQLPVFDTSCP